LLALLLTGRYRHGPLLLETLVDADRFRGTGYRAAIWTARDGPPGAVAWIGRTAIMVKPSKTFMSICWSAILGSVYAAIPPGGERGDEDAGHQ
jgi:hypothetical protein